MNYSRVALAAAALLLTGTTTIGCSGDDDAGFISSLRAAAPVARARSYDAVSQALPTSSIRGDAFATSDKSQLVASGEFVGARVGFGARWDESGMEQTPTDYGSSDAMANFIYLDFLIDDVIAVAAGIGVASDGVQQMTIVQPVHGAPNVADIASEVKALGRVVIFANRPSVYNTDTVDLSTTDGYWAVLEEGAFIATASPEGTLDFVAMPEADRAELVPTRGLSVQELVDDAKIARVAPTG